LCAAGTTGDRGPDQCSRMVKLPGETLKESSVCGCFYCLEVFPPGKIEDWTDNDDTALCPKCGIDSVIGSVSGYPIERKFLKKMHDQWF
jgi:hypothetical protein